MGKRKVALYHAFHTSLPIMAGYGFLGLTYGIYMHELGFNFLYPMLLALMVYAGSAEFLLGNMLLGSFHPLQAFLMVLMVNARHLFYGLSMLEEYKGLGWKKFFLIFGMSDETFALTSASKIPEGTDKGWYLLWITWLDETYWVIGATLGGLIGPFLTFDLKGLDFVLTAMFTAIFADNWLREKDHTSSISGLIISGLCLTIFSADHFIIPSMVIILIFLTLKKKKSMTLLQQIIMVSAGVAATMLTRFIPFIAFRPGKPTPKYILYLGKVLPASVFALLVVYCLRHIHSFSADSLAQVAAVAFTILIHVWKRNMMWSIAAGTLCYMLLIRILHF